MGSIQILTSSQLLLTRYDMFVFAQPQCTTLQRRTKKGKREKERYREIYRNTNYGEKSTGRF